MYLSVSHLVLNVCINIIILSGKMELNLALELVVEAGSDIQCGTIHHLLNCESINRAGLSSTPVWDKNIAITKYLIFYQKEVSV